MPDIQSRIPQPRPANRLRTATASPSSSRSFSSASSSRPSMQYSPTTRRMSSFGSTLSHPTSSHPTISTVRERDHRGQGLATFRDLREAEVSDCVFMNLNTPGPVTLYNERVPSRRPPDNDGNGAEGTNADINIHPIHNYGSTMATPGFPERSEYEIYCTYLSVKQRGSPLWEPGPRMTFPIEYRRSGISIGDVGVLNPAGYFTFLFNIFRPADHEINAGRVPNGFTPLDESKAQIMRGTLYDDGSCLASSSLRRTESSDFSFQTTGREGAVLVMPAGAVTDDLGNHKLVEKYIAANAKSWWEYVESDECGVPNDNVIQVVVGTDKVSAWGMATFENVQDPIEFELRNDGTGSQGRYKWKKINSGRAGPSEEEIRDLLPLLNMPLRNQCVFVRTLNVSASVKVRDASAVHVCCGCPREGMSDLSSPGQRTANIRISKRGLPISHPSKSLNEHLLAKCPNAEVVITSDSAWISVITENDDRLPSVEDICARVLHSYVICEKKGVVTLEKREDPYVIGRLFLMAPDQFMVGLSGTSDNNTCSLESDVDYTDKLVEPSDSKIDKHFSQHSGHLQMLEEGNNRDTEVVDPILDLPSPSRNPNNSSLSITNTRGQTHDFALIPSDGQLSKDHQFDSRKLLEPIISVASDWTSQQGGGSKPSTEGSTSVPWRPPSPVNLTPYGSVMYNCDKSTWCNDNMSAFSSSTHINWPSLSELPRRRQFGRPERYIGQDSYRGGSHFDSRDRRLSFDRASKTSTQSGVRSRYSVATSITTLLSRRSRAKAPRRELERSSSQSLKSAKSTSRGGQGTYWQIQTSSSSVYVNTPRRSHSYLSDLTNSSGLDWDKGLLDLTAKGSSQTTQIKSVYNEPLQYLLSPMEQAIQSRLRTFHVVGGAVTSGTLEGLVQFLITGSGLPGHTYYRDTFLMACSELTTPENLFGILSRRLSEEQHTSDEGSGTQYTIIVFIVYWLKSNCFSPTEKLFQKIRFFCEEVIRQHPALDSIAEETRQLIDAKVARPTALQASSPDEPILEPASITPRDLAVALGLLEGDHYKALQPSDYLQHLSYGQSDRVKTYNETNEKIRLWVIKSILHYDNVSSRSQLVKFYINTALECYSMRNFSSTVAISTALQSVSIENLRATMKAARKALSKKTQTKLPILSEIIDPQSNHRGYSNALQTAATVQERDTCIPWLAVHLKELDKVVRQPPTVLVDNQHLVNFTRHNRFMDRIKEMLHYLPPDLEGQRHRGQLTYLLNQLRDIDLSSDLEQQSLARSRAFSIQETPNERSFRGMGFGIMRF